MREWVGADYDPRRFDAERLKAEVAALAKRWSRKSAAKKPKGTPRGPRSEEASMRVFSAPRPPRLALTACLLPAPPLGRASPRRVWIASDQAAAGATSAAICSPSSTSATASSYAVCRLSQNRALLPK